MRLNIDDPDGLLDGPVLNINLKNLFSENKKKTNEKNWLHLRDQGKKNKTERKVSKKHIKKKETKSEKGHERDDCLLSVDIYLKKIQAKIESNHDLSSTSRGNYIKRDLVSFNCPEQK